MLLIGVIYAALGALAGALLDKLAATYLMLFLALTDAGIAQNPDVRRRHPTRLGAPASRLTEPDA